MENHEIVKLYLDALYKAHSTNPKTDEGEAAQRELQRMTMTALIALERAGYEDCCDGFVGLDLAGDEAALSYYEKMYGEKHPASGLLSRQERIEKCRQECPEEAQRELDEVLQVAANFEQEFEEIFAESKPFPLEYSSAWHEYCAKRDRLIARFERIGHAYIREHAYDWFSVFR